MNNREFDFYRVLNIEMSTKFTREFSSFQVLNVVRQWLRNNLSVREVLTCFLTYTVYHFYNVFSTWFMYQARRIEVYTAVYNR